MKTLQLKDFLNHLHFFSVQLQAYHWNFKGIDFLYFHKFFDERYSEVLEQKDKIAEYLRYKKEIALIDFTKAPVISVPKKDIDIVEAALDAYLAAQAECDKLLQNTKDPVLENILQQFMEDNAKIIYFLQSTLEK